MTLNWLFLVVIEYTYYFILEQGWHFYHQDTCNANSIIGVVLPPKVTRVSYRLLDLGVSDRT